MINNLDGFAFGHSQSLFLLDRWIIGEAHKLRGEVLTDYAKVHFFSALKKLHRFINEDLSGFYFDVIKNRLYLDTGRDRQSAQVALYHLLVIMKDIFATITPLLVAEMESIYPTKSDNLSVISTSSGDVELVNFIKELRSRMIQTVTELRTRR